ncbi:MAG: hypothetical protein R3F60_06255 [bacterium]
MWLLAGIGLWHLAKPFSDAKLGPEALARRLLDVQRHVLNHNEGGAQAASVVNGLAMVFATVWPLTPPWFISLMMDEAELGAFRPIFEALMSGNTEQSEALSVEERSFLATLRQLQASTAVAANPALRAIAPGRG